MKTALALILASLLGHVQAQACTYDPALLENKNELAAVALNKLQKAIDEVTSVQVQLDFKETKPTRLCPLEVQYTGVYTITWSEGLAGTDQPWQPRPCSGVVTVVKTVNTEKRGQPKTTITASNPNIVCAP